jgi:hypothetical protein
VWRQWQVLVLLLLLLLLPMPQGFECLASLGESWNGLVSPTSKGAKPGGLLMHFEHSLCTLEISPDAAARFCNLMACSPGV